MLSIMRIFAVAGHLMALQLIAGCITWWLSPWPWLALIACVLWLMVLLFDVRHPRFAGALPWQQQLCAFVIAQAPALLFGVWNVLYFCGVAPRFELGAFIVQLWLTPLAPVLACCPLGVLLERDLWLWALSVAPMLLIIVLVVASQCRRQTQQMDSPTAHTEKAH